MKSKNIWIIGIMLYFVVACYQSVFAQETILFGGGPTGGTFIIFTNGVETYGPIQSASEFEVRVQSSAGSVENFRKTDAGIWQMSVVYSGHVYLGRNGLMKDYTQIYENVLAVAWLYGAQAQLVVSQGSGIINVTDLVDKRVNVGRTGSGAHANCELFFDHLDIWDKIERHALGYNDAAEAFGNDQLDAFWLFTAYPSGAVITAAAANDIALVNVDADASSSGFYSKYPYFTKIIIPANTYDDVDYDSPSFQDSALWVANSSVSSDIVYEMLSLIYTDEGLAHIKAQSKAFEHMAVATGTDGIVTPFHPGAKKFWREKGFALYEGVANPAINFLILN
jgi:TRAP transporter TAXI family solute receptor